MILNVYAIFDIKTERHMVPFYMISDVEAVRAFTSMVNDGDGQVAAHPADYHLFKLCEWDDETGEFLGYDPRMLVAGSSVHEPKKVGLDKSQVDFFAKELKELREMLKK